MNNDIISHLNHLLNEACEKSASDIHLEPTFTGLSVRFRIDGLLKIQTEWPLSMKDAVISRIKVLAKLNIAEHRLPQEGRFEHAYQQQKYEIRTSTCPTQLGEKVALRVLNDSLNLRPLSELGMTAEQYQHFMSAIERPQGLILVTGPTGSGKTSTLYSALNHLNTFDKNVCSIEDPVEIQLSGVNQIAVNRKIGLDFAQILKALLRQDPDILMIGEIRDAETACLAIKAAETGHLVLATLHTQTALEALLRLKHLGVEPLHLSSCLSLLVAQRLLRKTSESGYCGRIAAFEVIRWNDQFTESFLRGDSIKHLQTEAKALGFKTLLEHATALSTAGLTSREEILRVC